jgi:hypothetical protein
VLEPLPHTIPASVEVVLACALSVLKVAPFRVLITQNRSVRSAAKKGAATYEMVVILRYLL